MFYCPSSYSTPPISTFLHQFSISTLHFLPSFFHPCTSPLSSTHLAPQPCPSSTTSGDARVSVCVLRMIHGPRDSKYDLDAIIASCLVAHSCDLIVLGLSPLPSFLILFLIFIFLILSASLPYPLPFILSSHLCLSPFTILFSFTAAYISHPLVRHKSYNNVCHVNAYLFYDPLSRLVMSCIS